MPWCSFSWPDQLTLGPRGAGAKHIAPAAAPDNRRADAPKSHAGAATHVLVEVLWRPRRRGSIAAARDLRCSLGNRTEFSVHRLTERGRNGARHTGGETDGHAGNWNAGRRPRHLHLARRRAWWRSPH